MCYNYMVKMFSEIEQEEIINEFLNQINMNDSKRTINRKIGMCKECKFNYSNIQLYKNKLSENIIKHICKYNYKECYKCKRLKQLNTFVNIDTCNKSKELIKLTEIIENEKEEDTTVTTDNIKDYYFTKLYQFPTFKFIKSNLLKDVKERHNYTRDIHNRIKDCYELYYKGNIKTVSAGVDLGDTPIYKTVEIKYIETYKNGLVDRFFDEYKNDDDIPKNQKNRRDCFKYIENNISITLTIFKIILSHIFNKQDNAFSNILFNDVGQNMYKHYTKEIEISERIQHMIFSSYPSIKDIKPQTNRSNQKQQQYEAYLHSAEDFE